MNVQEIINQIKEKINSVNTIQELNNLKVEYLGKTGIVTELQSKIKEIPNEEKKNYGMQVNEIKTTFNNLYDEKNNALQEKLLNQKLESEKIDISLPSKKTKRVYDGPEIESDENCFQKLNLPKGHPARDAQDTFYLKDEYERFLIRTQTSTAQIHAMEENTEKGPIRIVCPGKVYRRDEDATHSHQFMQIEGLVIDENVSMADLKGTLELFCKKILGEKTKVRFRPSYFPFTEPSVEVDVTCFKCGGKGCPLCKQTGWIEVLGAGMVHPNVLEMSGYDSKKYQGFAFGTGMDRFAMFKYGIPDIRTIYGNDIRFLNQFDRKDVE